MKQTQNIEKELRSIIRELQSISDGIRRDFSGIGQERCAQCLDAVIEDCNKMKQALGQPDLKGKD